MPNISFRLDSPVGILEQAVANVTTAANAAAGWLYLVEPDGKTLRLTTAVNAPPFQPHTMALCEENCLAEMLAHKRRTPQLFACPMLAETEAEARRGLRYHLTIPLYNDRRTTGLLNLAYAERPQFSEIEHNLLVAMSQTFSVLFDLSRSQTEAQQYATHTAFLLLLARSLAEMGDLQTALSATVEQTASMLQVDDVVIWLFSRDGRLLEPAATLTAPSTRRVWRPQAREGGLVGWVAEHGATLVLPRAEDDERFDPELDWLNKSGSYSLAATPLYHQRTIIGVLTVYHKADWSLNKQDSLLLEGIATLAAGAIRNLTMLHEIQEHAGQQQTLYKMSRQLSSGLDLAATLRRALGWVSRLCPVEVSMLWLTDANGIAPVAALGLELGAGQQLYWPLDKAGISGWVAQHEQAVILENPSADPRFNPELSAALHLEPLNILAAPMSYHGRTIGVVTLINKMGEPFSQADLTLISMATEMIAIAISNARLHNQTLHMASERERLHRQRVQTERLAIIGRLTASLSHEINNPMQAIRGALTLAMEELNDPEALREYVQLSLDESQRVTRLINRLRVVYRPQSDSPELLDLNDVIQDSLAMARKELSHQRALVEVDLDPNLPPLWAIASQLHLVILNLLLNLSDLIGQQGGGELLLRSYLCPASDGVARLGVELRAHAPNAQFNSWTDREAADTPQQTSFDLLLSQDIVHAMGGTAQIAQSKDELIISVELPGKVDESTTLAYR